jgi:outer membrane protein OmpA-like peptidoglycan-associated protein
VTQTIAHSWLCVKQLDSLLLRAALALVTLVVLAPQAEAQSRFSMENYHPNTNPRTGLSHTYGASLQRPGATETTLLGSFGWAPLTLITTEDQTAGKLVSYAAGLHVMTSVGVTRWFEIGIDLPIMFMGAGDSIQGFRDEPLAGDATVLGMVRLVPVFRVWGTERADNRAGFGLALVLDTSLPTGDVDAYAGDDGFRMDPKVAFDVRLSGGTSLMANAGYRLRPETALGTLEIDDALTFGAGASVPVVGIFELAAEVFGAALVAGPAATEEIPVEVLGTARLVGERWLGQFGGGTGVTGGAGAPDYRLVASVGYHSLGEPDRDGDGLRNGPDVCPDDAEDRDGYRDNDGCPDLDNDDDGIADADDACPDEPGTVGANGCPESLAAADSDGDGIVPPADRCPTEPEDFDGVDDEDGCPDESDSDGDGVVDSRDGCPAEPGPVSNAGCPDIETSDFVLLVQFEFDTDVLTATARGQLDALVTRLARYSTSSSLEVVGHTDSLGAEGYNSTLSLRRAEVVRNYLVAAGVAAGRIAVRGAGADEPITFNTSDEGRAANRRAEIRIRAAAP